MAVNKLSNRAKAVYSSIADTCKIPVVYVAKTFNLILATDAAASIDRYMRSTFESAPTIYDKAIDAGASGGKLLGAGAGGFVLFYVKNDKKRKFFRAFNNKNLIKFRFENKGSAIIQT